MYNRDWNRAARDQEDEPLFYTKTRHAFSRSCQCKRCVRLHTITIQDREFLRTIGVVWNASPTPSTPTTPKESREK
jgi:hypothetical protein